MAPELGVAAQQRACGLSSLLGAGTISAGLLGGVRQKQGDQLGGPRVKGLDSEYTLEV